MTNGGQRGAIRPLVSPLYKLIPLVTDSLTSPHTQRAYARALGEFFSWYERNLSAGPFRKSVVNKHLQALIKSGYSPSTVNQSLTALRKLAEEAADNGLLDPTVPASLAPIKAQKRLGRRVGRWLPMKQACDLVQAPDQETLKGKRDRVLLGLLMECGLRREEACKLDVSQLQKREGRPVIVDVVGKGGRIRTVPIPANLAARIRAWIAAAAIVEGPLLRPINKSGVVLDGGITSAALYKHVKEYGGKLAPHDLRRTFAKLAHTNKAPVEQIKESLGHSSIKTTEIYLGIAQDLTNAPCDVLGIDDGRGDDE
jgi:integrase/recombinase XerD